MDLAHIAERTDLPLRTLRYVLEQGLLPVAQLTGRGRGVPRDLVDSEAVPVAVAAAMLEAGLKGAAVAPVLLRLSRARWRSVPKPNPFGVGKKNALTEASINNGQTVLELGDGLAVRLTHKLPPAFEHEVTTGWLELTRGAQLDDAFDPVGRVVINVGRLRDRLRAG